jgi:hypothetical protein
MTYGLLAFSACPPHYSNRYAKADRLIFPAPFIDVLAPLFLDESAEIFHSEDEALMDAILFIIRGELPV